MQSAKMIEENAPVPQSSATLLDRELQGAFQECEEQIATFGVFSHTNTSCSADHIDSCLSEAVPATDNDEPKCSYMKEDLMSLPISLAESQAECDQGCQGNVGAPTTNLASCTEKAVFCFKDYVLGKTQSEQARTENPKEYSEKLHSETKKRFQKEPERETNTDTATSEVNKISEIQKVPAGVSSIVSNDSSDEEGKIITGPVEKPQMTPERGIQIITTTIKDNKSAKGFSTKNDINYCSVSENSDRGEIQQNTQTLLESEKQAQIITQTKAQSEANPDLKTEADNQIELLDTLRQLGLFCSSPPKSLSNQTHLTPLEATLAPTLDHMQRTEQQDNYIGADGLCNSIAVHETVIFNSTSKERHETCLNKVSTDCTAIDFKDVKANAHEHEKRCSSEACPLEKEEEEEENGFFIGSKAGTQTVVRGKTHSLSRTSTKGIKTEEESAFEKASASDIDFTPPLTSTMPEMIECEGVREKETGDSERVKTTEKGYLDGTTELADARESLCSEEKLSEMIAAEVNLCSLSFPETNNSPEKEAKEVEAVSEVRWSSEMLQNSEEKGAGRPVDCPLGMDSLSATDEKETGTASVEDMAVVAASTPEFNDRRDWKEKRSELLEKKGEGGTEEGRGKERGGAETLHRDQPLSLTVTKSYPHHDNGVVAAQQRDELVTLVTADIADTALPFLCRSKTTISSLINPSSPVFLLNPTERDSKEASEKKTHVKESFNVLGEKQPNEDISHLPAASTNGIDLVAQTAYQQVKNTLLIQTEISSTQQNSPGTGNVTCHQINEQHSSSTSQMDMRSGTRSFNNVDGSNVDTHDDMPRQVTGFASLPPLTVHENLWQPVSETSFSFQGLFSDRKPDPPSKEVNAICESTSEAGVTEENVTMIESHVMHNVEQKGNDLQDKTNNNITTSAEESLKSVSTSDIKTCENNAVNQNSDFLLQNKEENQEKDEIVKITKSTLEHKALLENTNKKGVGLQDTVMEEGGSDVSDLSDLIVSNVKKKLEVVLTTKEVDKKEAKLVEYDVRETCEDNSILSDSVQQESKLGLQTSEDVSQKHCMKSEKKTVTSDESTGITNQELTSNAEEPCVIFIGCPQAKCEEHMSELQYQTDSSHDTGPVSEVAMGAVSIKDPIPTAIILSSAVEGSIPSANANIQSDTKVPIMLRPPNHMMSHWEVIKDYNVSPPGQEMRCSQEVKTEMSSTIVKTVTVEKTEPVENIEEKNNTIVYQNNNTIAFTAECSKAGNMQSRQSVNSTGISQQNISLNTVILEEHPREKPEENTSELQYQSDLCHDGGAVSEIATSIVSTKYLTSQVDVSDMGEGAILSFNIQSDPKVPIVLQPPGPMMSHLEVINDDDVSVSEEETQCSYNKISTLDNGSVGAADTGSMIVKTDNVQKPYEHLKSVETKRVKIENDKSRSCINVLTPDILTDAASSMQDITIASKEVEGTNLAPNSLHSDENANKIEFSPSTDSAGIIRQDQKSNALILEKCFQTKPEEDTSRQQYQTDRDHDSGAVMEVTMSIMSTKDLTSPNLAVSGTREGVNIPSDLVETSNEHSEPVETMNENIENDNKSSTCMNVLFPAVTNPVACSVQGTKLTCIEVEGTHLAPGSLHSKENANNGIDFVVQEDPGNETPEMNVLTREPGRELSTCHEGDQITHTSITRQATKQNTETPLILQHCDESKFQNSNALTEQKVQLGHGSSETEDGMSVIQSSPSAHAEPNSSMKKEHCVFELSTVIPHTCEHTSLKPTTSENHPVSNQILIEDKGSVNMCDTVNKTYQEHTGEENQRIKLEQSKGPKCANDANLFKEKNTTDKLNVSENKLKCEHLVSNLPTLEDVVSGKLEEEITKNKKTNSLDELQENNQNLVKEADKEQIDVKQELTNVDHIKDKDKNEEKSLDETVPEILLKTCLSDFGLILTGFVNEVQSYDGDLIEATHPSMDQDLVQVTCCETDQTQDQTVFRKLDLAPGLKIKPQSTELQQSQQGIAAAETVKSDQRNDDASLKEKVSCPSYEVQANEILETRVESENSCSSFEKYNIISESDVCLEGKLNQSEPGIKPTQDVSFVIKVMNENSTEDRNQTNQIVNNQENKSLSISAAALKNTELNSELKELLVSVIQASQEGENKPHFGHASESQIGADKPGCLEEVVPDRSKSVELANDSPKPCENSSTSHHEDKTEDQCFSAITFGKSKCTDMGTSVPTKPMQPSVCRTPAEKIESVANVSQGKDNEELKNKAQIHKIELPSTSLQTETLAWEMKEHNEACLDPKRSKNKEWQDTFDPQHTESQDHTTSAGTEEKAKNKKTQTAISEEVMHMGHRKEEISACKEEGRENKTAEGRKLTDKLEQLETKAIECDLKDIQGRNEGKFPEHKEENTDVFSFTVKAASGGTGLQKSIFSDGLQAEQENELLLSPKLTDVATVLCSQDPSQTLLDANADSGHETSNSFIQTMHVNASEILKPERGSKDGDADITLFSKVVQTEKANVAEYTEQVSTDKKTSALSEEDVSDSPGAAASSVTELNKNIVSTEESCESSDWLRALKEAASVSQTQEYYKTEVPRGSPDDRYLRIV